MKPKKRKIPLFAAVANFFFWGVGYIYLDVKIRKAICLMVALFSVWVISLWYVTFSGPLSFAGLFWIMVWYFIISFYIGFDAYNIARVKR
jgi:hypothetical protein